jgi:Glutamine synthetase, catalytic domain
MPKPFVNLTGNGCHTHVSVWDTAGESNLFFDPQGELGLSQLGYQFTGGVLNSAEALCAITNPTVNSYKRINAAVTASGATWFLAPSAIAVTIAPTRLGFPMPDDLNFGCQMGRQIPIYYPPH